MKGFCPSFVSVHGGKLKKQAAVSNDQVMAELPEPEIRELDQPWNVLVTGVGGTGVLTVTAVLAMAAHLEGKGVATMNQTGLAQKFGPVVSHLRIANHQEDIHAVRIPAGDADVVIGCDLVVTATDDALAKTNIERTHAVVNDTMTPTAEFVHNPDAVFHDEAMKQSIREEVGADKVDFLPASELATALLGDSIATNLFMLGYAWQKGLLPVSAKAILRAVELNGVQVEFNQQAFDWGRRAALDLPAVEQASGVIEQRFVALGTLDQVVEFREKDLQGWQDSATAESYRQRVAEVNRQIVGKLGSDSEQAESLSIVFAKALHRVTAYKDEYEVARLYSDGRFIKQLQSRFEGDYELEFHMAPPMLSKIDPDSGEPIKRRFGPWMLRMFALLAKFKGLRGSKWDVFGYSEERKLERALPTELNNTVDTLLGSLSTSNAEHAEEILRLILDVRGYGHVKQRNYDQYQLRLQQQLCRYRGDEISVVQIQDVA